jgi:hypothetical protein
MRPISIVIPLYALLGGAISALLFASLHKQLIYGVTAPFLPYLGIVLSGLIYGRAGLTAALMVAIPILYSLLDFQSATIIILTQIIPINIFIRALLMGVIRLENKELIWSPPCWGVSLISIYGALFYAILILFDNPLFSLMQGRVNDLIKLIYDETQYKMIAEYSYMLLAVEYVAHMVSIIIITFIGHKIAGYLNLNRRNVLRFANYCTPLDANFLILALSFCTAYMGEGRIMEAAKSSCLILLIPYIYSGITALHFKIMLIKNSNIWIIILYAALIILNGSALMLLAIYGIALHGRQIFHKIMNNIQPK